MGIWFLMLFMILLIPGIMLGAGKMMRDHPPEKVNWIIGYRTARSMKNPETWDFANRHMGRTWMKAAFILLPASLAVYLPTLGRGEEAFSTVALILMFVQLAALLLSILPTERALKSNFDKDGNRIEPRK